MLELCRCPNIYGPDCKYVCVCGSIIFKDIFFYIIIIYNNYYNNNNIIVVLYILLTWLYVRLADTSISVFSRVLMAGMLSALMYCVLNLGSMNDATSKNSWRTGLR